MSQSNPLFERYIGIDYSGANTPEKGLTGLRVYEATRREWPREVLPPVGPGKYWSRRSLAGWLLQELSRPEPAMVGIDHGFSFPMRYFESCNVPHNWHLFLEDFRMHWPTHQRHTYVEFVRDGVAGNGAVRSGSPRWRRITEKRARAKSVFHFDVPGSVAKSTHAGLPWLAWLREQLPGRVRFWPFEGWRIPPGNSVIAEMYPSLWSNAYDRASRTPDQHDAYTLAAWLRETDSGATLASWFEPELTPGEKQVAELEGWILGVLP